MTTIKNLLMLGCLGVLSQCASTSPSQGTIYGGGNARVDVETPAESDNSTLNKGCPLDKMQWLYGSQQFDKTRQEQLAARIVKAAQTDAATLDRLIANKNTNPMAVSSALKVYIDEAALIRTPVSEAFYKQYVNSRMTMCAVMDALRSGSIKQDDGPKVAGNTFREIAKSFEVFTKKTN